MGCVEPGGASGVSVTEVVTSRCAGLGQPEVRLFVDSSAVPEGDVQWMAQVLESMVESWDSPASTDTVLS